MAYTVRLKIDLHIQQKQSNLAVHFIVKFEFLHAGTVDMIKNLLMATYELIA
jgi:hypothetical protein